VGFFAVLAEIGILQKFESPLH